MNRPVTFEVAKKIIEQILRNLGIHLTEDKWNILLSYAEIDGIIDYRKMLDVYK